MATFTAGTSFVDGVTGDVTAAKLGALVTNAVPLPNLITDRTAETAVATDDLLVISNTSSAGALNKMTVANLMKAELTGTINSTSGTIATLNSTTGTIATLNSTTGTIATLNSTTGTIATLNSTTGTIATLVATNNSTLQGLNIGRGGGNIASNTSLGASALASNTTGIQNTASGVQSLYSNTTGYQNTASGVNVLYLNTTGVQNSASGFQAGYGTGTNSNTTGGNNTFIGNESVGASATANNVVTLGNGSIATLRCQVTSITALSDKRDKKDIANLSVGLDFIGKLRPVSFVWDTRDKAKVNIPDAGFIAQELLVAQEEAGVTIPNLVSQENPEKLEAAYGTLIPVLVQAIKELKAKVELLEEKNK